MNIYQRILLGTVISIIAWRITQEYICDITYGEFLLVNFLLLFFKLLATFITRKSVIQTPTSNDLEELSESGNPDTDKEPTSPNN